MSLTILLFLLQTATATRDGAQAPVAPPAEAPAAAYVPERVFDTGRDAFTDFEVMIAELTRADVVIVGEQHDDPNTHRLEAALLEGLSRRNVAVTVSLEMFERDVQQALDAYLAGERTEQEFLDVSRPWPRYATDYRPLVEAARLRGWPVIAANVPRKYAASVAKAGLEALADLPSDERAHVARDLQCPIDSYFDRFAETMSGHPVPDSESTSAEEMRKMTERYYYSQCVKDETMAEAIARAVEDHPAGSRTVVHYTGAFHSDFRQGVVERVRRRLPGRRIASVSVLPVRDIDIVAPDDRDRARADYLVYTVDGR